MRNFHNDRRSGGRSFNNRDSGGSNMFRATCDECGDSCELPFKPSGSKPVYCSRCFRKEDDYGSGGSRGRDSGRSDRRDSYRSDRRDSYRSNSRDDRQMYNATCDECGKSCELPFKPSSDKPVYCSHCFGSNKSDKPKGKKPDQYKEQFEKLNAKLDKIMKTLEAHTAKTDTTSKKPAKVVKKELEKLSAKVETKTAIAKKPVKKAVTKKTVKPSATAKKPAAKKAPAKKVAVKKVTKASKPKSTTKTTKAKKTTAKKK